MVSTKINLRLFNKRSTMYNAYDRWIEIILTRHLSQFKHYVIPLHLSGIGTYSKLWS